MNDGEDISNCGVCLGDYDYDPAQFFNQRTVTARKQHKCYECSRQIEKGEQYNRVVGKWDRNFDQFNICLECDDIAKGLSCDGSRMYGNLWEEIEDRVFPEMSFACVAQLSTAAGKDYLVKRWHEWSESRRR